MPTGLARTACANAAFSVSGVPSVFTVRSVQPSASVPCLTMSDSCAHSGVPQLMKKTVLPFGTVAPTGVVTGIVVGRGEYFATKAFAAAVPPPLLPVAAALAEPVPALLAGADVLPPLPLELHAESASAALTTSAPTTL